MLKLLGLGKTRTKKASPDMLNFYIVLAGQDMAVLTRAGGYSMPHEFKPVQKMKDLSKTWVSTGKEFQDFRLK